VRTRHLGLGFVWRGRVDISNSHPPILLRNPLAPFSLFLSLSLPLSKKTLSNPSLSLFSSPPFEGKEREKKKEEKRLFSKKEEKERKRKKGIY
jgi:hypothetical protein